MKRVLICLLACLPLMALADNNDEIKKKLNSIKKSSLYLYAEATAPTEEEAHDLAEEMLYEEINAWAANKRKLQNSASFAVNNKQTLWTTVSLPRGNMIRSFIYVKKSDILPVENSEVIANSNVPAEEQAANDTPAVSVPECVTVLAGCTEYADFVEKIQQMKVEGKVKSYARYAQLDHPEACYLAIYNTAGKVVAILTAGDSRQNVATGKADSVANYSGCGAIGFEVNN